MSLLASQCRAARAMLGFSQRDLAKHAEVAHRTIADFETGSRTPHPRTLKAIRETLEKNGVVFIDADPTGPEALGAGVRLKTAEVTASKSSDKVSGLSSEDLEKWWDELTPDNNSHKT
ncbi:helix-turn-helix transcriptional regulator [Gluconobacter sphaericus]|uniref:helix-turn-helix domain-containing protein n=1 Tax=Gluconobacter sphaericus TaxID=574987 RepID=UPI001B8CAED2|nr:helix-turn-helix transcriptional regulator [Gluconobacter sphaericus]MBS1098414.1 helix-turn-helix transcriptional regulator [Gluconobacter sphaericus]